jgi:riboflavin kinase/FMN adenylyltransferase
MERLCAEFGDAAGLPPACVATLGNFDGMHTGHRQLVGCTAGAARLRRLPSVVVTFDPHPMKILSPGGGPGLLMTPAQKLDALESLGVDVAWTVPFGRGFSRLSADAFLDGLFGALRPAELHIGQAFRFGRDRAGDARALAARGEGAGCAVRAHSFAAPDGGAVSSSRVRRLLLDGDVALARDLLGAPFRLTGIVVEGERMGRRLGFPTANLAWEQELLPAPGVYVTAARWGALRGPALGVTNVGARPTFGGGRTTVETHLPGVHASIYGAGMEIEFLHRIRGEEAFAGPEQLQAAIALDVEKALALWAAKGREKIDGWPV